MSNIAKKIILIRKFHHFAQENRIPPLSQFSIITNFYFFVKTLTQKYHTFFKYANKNGHRLVSVFVLDNLSVIAPRKFLEATGFLRRDAGNRKDVLSVENYKLKCGSNVCFHK